jgi:DHA2 family multidrug resistance protein-like MFS transporter
MGSVGVAIYRGRLADRLPPDVPAGAAELARDTLGGAVAVAAHLPDRLAAPVLTTAREAFVAGMQLTSAIGAAAGIALAVLVLVVLRHQPPAGAGEPGAEASTS